MSPVLVLYGTGEGRTAKIAERIAVMKQIAKDLLTEDRETDGDMEFTDWGTVDAFAADIAVFVENRLGVVLDTTEDPAS
ncbi:hypothetical protein [Halorussus amylolyticus]|uniref:hypothetical protein n=1 Tax=Halorussus amylolyticus TaxID=1126242 RepID=UPI00192F778E|nr:hypothetical protein [Halorussus amylolyticus]